jgi:glycosyltransferase involved in cell wall biosynthesis
MFSVKKITILIPVFNEEATVGFLLERLDAVFPRTGDTKYQYEYLFVNDGSSDGTHEVIQRQMASERENAGVVQSRISYINLSRNFGKETAMMAGLDNANGDAVVIIDADLQDPPELIPQMIEYWEQGYDDVYARRTSRKGESFLKKWTSKQYYRVLQRSTNVKIQLDTGDFRLLDRRCVLALRDIREQQRNMKALFSWIGYKKKEVTYEREPRVSGDTKFNYLKLVGLALDGITSFTTAPLRLSFLFGAIISLFSFAYACYIVVRTIIFGVNLSGYASTFTAILFLGGVQLLSIGILGEYIGRTFVETKKRPLYYIEEIDLV